jgi:uncharacterized protein YdhG (YjbR/CyaY superfamily)
MERGIMPVNAEVEQYLRRLPLERRRALETLRALIREVVPEAVESLDYRMPTYRFKGNPLCAIASRKQYMVLYVHTRLLPKYRGQFEGLSMGKECIRFRHLDELPIAAVRNLLREAARVERA